MKLTVKNFQIHKDNTVNIPEGETTYLEGNSDTGKSAMMRAMRWVGENKPDGGSFVTFKQPRGTNAISRFECDGHVVERERGKSVNIYRLDGEEFKAFGRSVPEPIAKVLNLSPYTFQLQGEVPFLIGESPTEAAKKLSEACGLGVIDTAVQYVRDKKTIVHADIRKAEILLESATSRLNKASGELSLAEKLEMVVKLDAEYREIEGRQSAMYDLLYDEPQGKLLNVTKAREVVAIANAAKAEQEGLLNMTRSIQQLLQNEPTGTLIDISAVKPLVETTQELFTELHTLSETRGRLRAMLDDAPTGKVLDLTGVKAAIKKTATLLTEKESFQLSRATIIRVLDDRPSGKPILIDKIRPLIISAQEAHGEKQMLEGMRKVMREILKEEPTGMMIDTAGLLAAKAEIKVCPTCGKEL